MLQIRCEIQFQSYNWDWELTIDELRFDGVAFWGVAICDCDWIKFNEKIAICDLLRHYQFQSWSYEMRFAIESESIASEKLNFRIVWDEIWERKCDCYWDEKVQRTWNLGEKMRLTETVGLNPYWNSYWIGWLESVWDWDEKVQRKWDLREKGRTETRVTFLPCNTF
jgi:hypothetical protein